MTLLLQLYMKVFQFPQADRSRRKRKSLIRMRADNLRQKMRAVPQASASESESESAGAPLYIPSFGFEVIDGDEVEDGAEDVEPLDIDSYFLGSCSLDLRRHVHVPRDSVSEIISFAQECQTDDLNFGHADVLDDPPIEGDHAVGGTVDVIEVSPPSSKCSSTVASFLTMTSVEIADQLEQLGLLEYLQFAVQRQDAHLKTVVNRFACLLEWCVSQSDAFASCTLESLQMHIKSFIAEHYDLLHTYVQYLSEHKHYQPATVIGHIDDIRICCSWFALFRSKTIPEETRMKQHDMLGFLTSAKHVRKIFNKKVKNMHCNSSMLIN